MAYVRRSGGARIRGLGDGIAPGTLNCPGDPGCPGGPPIDLSNLPMTGPLFQPASQAALSLMESQQAAAQKPGLTDWINSNAKSIALVAGIVLVVGMVGRR